MLEAASRDEDGQVAPVVAARVAEVRAVEHGGVVEERLPVFGDGFEFCQEFGEDVELGLLDDLELVDLRRVLAVVREVMPVVLHAGNGRDGVHPGELEGDRPGRVGLQGEDDHVIHEPLFGDGVVFFLHVLG